MPSGLSKKTFLKIARALSKTSPPLIAPIPYSETSIKNDKLYNNPKEIYTLVLEEPIQGVYTPLTRCYSNSCSISQPDCYSPLCPNRFLQQKLEVSPQRLAAPSMGSSASYDTVSLMCFYYYYYYYLLRFFLGNFTCMVSICFKRAFDDFT